jgi:hypothetical protein
MEKDFFYAKPLPARNGYTWTLPSRLGEMLVEIESLYGKRDPNWSVLGIEFSEDGPQCWYPGNTNNVLIQLSNKVEDNLAGACYELSHEAVHLLSPTGKRDENVLEEGLAVYYAKKYIADNFPLYQPIKIESYNEAFSLVKKFLDINPCIIKEVRKEVSTISKIKENILRKYIPSISIEDSIKLAEKFVR